MFQVKVTNSMFIAHSLPDESFGPAQNLQGAKTVTYTHLTQTTNREV